MPLPKKTERHHFEVELPSGKKVKYTPWLVRDEQEFLYATEGLTKLTDNEEIKKHIMTLISKCVIDVDLENLSYTDLYFLIIEIRKRSKGNEHEVLFQCPKCGTKNKDITIDLTEDLIIEKSNISDIEVGNYTFSFREASQKIVKELENIESNIKRAFLTLVKTLISVSDEEQVYTNFTEQEVIDFFENSLQPNEFNELMEKYINNIGYISISKIMNCSKCNHEIILYVDNIVDFFV